MGAQKDTHLPPFSSAFGYSQRAIIGQPAIRAYEIDFMLGVGPTLPEERMASQGVDLSQKSGPVDPSLLWYTLLFLPEEHVI